MVGPEVAGWCLKGARRRDAPPKKNIMKSSHLVVSVWPFLASLAACAGNVSSESSSADSEAELTFRAGTTVNRDPILTSPRPTPRISALLDPSRPVFRFASRVVIDDFTTGQPPITLSDWDTVTYQSGPAASIIGATRRTSLKVMSAESATRLDVPPGGPMLIDAEAGSFWSADLRYGFGEEGARPLNLATGGYDRFRLNFDALDAGVDYSISVADGNGNWAYSEGIRTSSSSPSAFYTDFLFGSLHAPADFDWEDVDAVSVTFYTVSPQGGSDLTLRSIIVQ